MRLPDAEISNQRDPPIPPVATTNDVSKTTSPDITVAGILFPDPETAVAVTPPHERGDEREETCDRKYGERGAALDTSRMPDY